MVSLASGEHWLLGIPFQVGEGILHLGSKVLPNQPEKISGIKVGRRFTRLHILHASAYAVDEKDVRIGSYTLHYEDGTTQIIPIANGRDVCGWWNRPGAPEPSEGKIAWKGVNDSATRNGATVRLFMSTWENPQPDKAVLRIDYASTMTNCAPFCVAMTMEKPLTARAAARPVTAADLEQLWKQLAGDDNQASDAIETLAGAPKQAIPFLSAKLRAVQPAAVEKKIALLISQLDDKDISVRENATSELEKLGVEALPQLRWFLVKATWLKVRHRVESLVEKLETATLTPEQTRSQRVLLICELTATAEAHQVLEEVAKGNAGAWLAPEAQAALKRLKKPGDGDTRRR
jgi:hypothetical protein